MGLMNMDHLEFKQQLHSESRNDRGVQSNTMERTTFNGSSLEQSSFKEPPIKVIRNRDPSSLIKGCNEIEDNVNDNHNNNKLALELDSQIEADIRRQSKLEEKKKDESDILDDLDDLF